MAGYRVARVRHLIQQEISILLAREVSDPRLANVNVTRVEVSGDLRHAQIFVAPIFDDEEATQAQMQALDRAAGFFRRHLAHRLDLRFAPHVHFRLDDSIERGEHFIQALEQLREDEGRTTNDEQ